MKFSYNWLKEFVPKLPKPDKLADILTVHAFEVESVTQREKDYVLDVKILPNRMADASGHGGLARDIAAIIGKSAVVKTKTVKEGKRSLRDVIQVEVKTPLCRRYALRGMTGVRVVGCKNALARAVFAPLTILWTPLIMFCLKPVSRYMRLTRIK